MSRQESKNKTNEVLSKEIEKLKNQLEKERKRHKKA